MQSIVMFMCHLLHPVLLVQDRVDDQLGGVAPDHTGGGGVTEQVDAVHPRLERRHSTVVSRSWTQKL